MAKVDYKTLQLLEKNGIINVSHVLDIMTQKEKNEIIKKHEERSKIWQASDSRWKTYVNKDGKRILKAFKNREDLNLFLFDFYKKENDNPSIAEVFEDWNNWRLNEKKIAESTHTRNIQIFNRHYKEFGKEKLKDIESVEFSIFLESQIEEHNLTSKAFSNLITITRGFLKYAKRKGYVNFNIDEMLSDMIYNRNDFSHSNKKASDDVYSDSEFKTIFSYLLNNLDVHNIAILLMFVCGLRVGEVVALKYCDIASDYSSINISRTERRFRNSKGQYELIITKPKTQAAYRTVYIPSSLQYVVRKLVEMNKDSEFLISICNERLSAHAIRMRLQRICKKLEIKNKSCHKCRKTYASILLDNDISKTLVIDLMGHRDINTTEEHYHRIRTDEEEKAEIINSLPDFHIA